MAYFNRSDICEAHLALEWDYNEGGVLHERESNIRRNMSTAFQLGRMRFRPSILFMGYRSLSENGKDIYDDFVSGHNLPTFQE